MVCWKCGKEYDGKIFRTTTCECGADLHVCYNCKFFLEGSHYDCVETVSDIVTDKEHSNLCEYFQAGKNEKNKIRYEDGDPVFSEEAASISNKKASALFSSLDEDCENSNDAKLTVETLFGESTAEKPKSSKEAFNSLFGGDSDSGEVADSSIDGKAAKSAAESLFGGL